ncbi:MAG: hypothetical protein KIT63_21070 [Rhodoferax sp.]|nr:hypothetical protein [Rhodoferax sp.]
MGTLHALGVTPVGVETDANIRRMEKSLRLQNADQLTEYNLFECDLARPKVTAADWMELLIKESEFRGRGQDGRVIYGTPASGSSFAAAKLGGREDHPKR